MIGYLAAKARWTDMVCSTWREFRMEVKAPNEISKEYYQFVDEFTQTSFENEKILGKFYTDVGIATSMMQILCQHYVCNTFSSELRIIDPFCGDGRLIISLLSELLEKQQLRFTKLFISIWDVDEVAVSKAKYTIIKFCKQHNLKCEIDACQADAFVKYATVQKKYDICVTNPPWSILKPQKIFNKNNDQDDMMEYRSVIEQYDSYMKDAFAISQPSSKFGKWRTNLARCGVEVALRLIKHDGYCGLVSPASLLNDQVSNRIRKWIFENYKIINISYYPAELKLYGTADISSITMVIKGGETDQDLCVKIYNDKNNYKRKNIEKATFEYIKRKEYSIPLKTGIEAIPIMMKFEQMSSTEEFCNARGLRFTRELDETKVKEKLLPSGSIEFAKGYMVDRYTFKSDHLFLNEEIVSPPLSSYMNKIVWRDVSRDSQLRRIKATLLPSGYICGNSLGVICGKDTELSNLKIMLAIMNSMVYEYQARSMLVSNHVSAGIVKKIRIPDVSGEETLVELVDKQLAGEDVEEAIELAVAHLYDLSADEYKIIVDSFEMSAECRSDIIQRYCKNIKMEKRKI